jgi:polysaccharide biosynthesis protein PslG
MKRIPLAGFVAVVLFGAVGGLSPLGEIAAEDKPDHATDVTRSPFGIGSCHINNVSAKANMRWMPQMVAIGISSHRMCHTGWGSVEPQEGKWTWDELDKQMSYLEGQHIAFGGILAGSGKWNTKDKKGTLPVNNIPAWSKYVSEVVKHAKGRIKYWEVWNEPPNGTGRDQTAADYARIVIAAHDAAKIADPNCLVGMAAQSVNLNYLDQAIKAGAKGHFDYITLHPYEVAGCTLSHPGTEVVYLQIARTTRKMLAAQDPARVNCPIIFTEIGCAGGPTKERYIGGPTLQAEAVVKYYSMGIAQGIACIQWFEGMDGDSGPMGLLKGNGEKRPSYTALAQMIKHFGQRPTYLGWVLLNDKHYGFVFQGAKGTVMTTWAATKTPDKIDFGRPVQIVDPLTGNAAETATYALTTVPILVAGVPDDLVKLAKSNKVRPFPWGGDYTDARSVSVSFGEKNVEKGLHTKSAESIAADVLAYGGSARAGNIPGGNVYMVDPNFLSYTTIPIEISVVVRRNAANDPAKLNLEYESTTGYKKAEPYEVPDNKKWHTTTWKIDDSQFVSKWAFNFRLNSGKYAIQSVTVRKLDR